MLMYQLSQKNFQSAFLSLCEPVASKRYAKYCDQQHAPIIAVVSQSGAGSQQRSLPLLADLQGDLPQCSSIQLEGHQNKVTDCVWNANKNQLASA